MAAGTGFVVLDGIEITGFEAQVAAQVVKKQVAQAGTVSRFELGKHFVFCECTSVCAEFVQATIANGQQPQLVKIRVVVAPATAQVAQQSIGDDEA